MYGVEILKAEHQNILHFTEILEENMVNVLDGEEIDLPYLRHAVKFIREYADGHHHQKEEEYLFKVMLDEIGDLAEKVITTGMMIEHDIARLTVSELTEAIDAYEKDPSTSNKLDIIGHTMSYVYQIRRHIEKEDEAIFGFANRMLSEESKDWVDKNTRKIEESTEQLIEKYDIFIKK